MGRHPPNARVREPAVAGAFYPAAASDLRAALAALLGHASADAHPAPPAKALIVPHAGYVYSGSVAAAAYVRLVTRRSEISKVVIIGPSHRAYFQGIALPEADAFATPLGEIRIDVAGKARLAARGDVLVSDAPHELEHCIEVQLPFLQTVLDEFTLIPLLAGVASPQYVASVLTDVWGGPETLVLASSDLSHYHPYGSAQQLDAQTAAAIVARHSRLSGEQACGAVAINGLMARARELGLAVDEIAHLNSGDTSGDRARVVGYGAFALHDA
ncbi:MAG TPA: AmmeMemoRadiSam system protein B [Steroidobacteraceae bacterium]|nr:AmmeMemoRadiSam system protein B [Steroidobacteraceae bacterium]